MLAIQKSQKLLKLERKLQLDLDTVLDQEEIMWYQRSREEWITSGDRNTKFYRASTIIRCNRNKIAALRNTKGEWVSNPSAPANMVLRYYKILFREEKRDTRIFKTPRGLSKSITYEQARKLRLPFPKEEIKQAVFEMAPFKSREWMVYMQGSTRIVRTRLEICYSISQGDS